MIKLNTLLAKVEHGTSTFNRMIGDYAVFFKITKHRVRTSV